MAGGRFFDLSDERMDRLRRRRRAEGLASAEGTSIPRRPEGIPPPPSFAQERLWFLDRLAAGDAHLAVPASLLLEGDLDPAALGLALADVVVRHEPLRSRFREVDGESTVEVVEPAEAFRRNAVLPRADLSGLAEESRRVELERLSDRFAGMRFDLSTGRLLAALLADLGRMEGALLLAVHHVAADGWSLGVLFKDLARAYRLRLASRGELDARPLLPEPSVRYGDWAAWQRARLRGDRLASEVAWWRDHLEGAPRVLDLPADRPPTPAGDFRGATVRGALEAPLADRLRRLGRDLEGSEASPFMVLLALLGVLLARWTGEDDLVIGTPVAGRTRRETEELVGLFLNHLALRLAVPPDAGFRAVLAAARDGALGAYARQEVPFERLLEELAVPRDLATTPLFQVFLNLLSFPPPPAFGDDGLAVSALAPPRLPARFDLTVYADDRGPGGPIRLTLVHDARRFDPPRMEETLRQLVALAGQVAADPERPAGGLSLLTDAARRALPDPRRPQDAGWPGPVDAAVDRHARARPGAPAVIAPDGSAVSYARLALAARELAGRLAAAGVRRGDVVAVHAHREAALVAALVAVHRAGAAFLLLDPAHPPARNALCCRRAAPSALLALAGAPPVPEEVRRAVGGAARLALGCLEEHAEWPVTEEAAPAAARRPAGTDGRGSGIGPDDAAYVAFTSGSTGEPKGVLGLHRSLTHFLPWQEEAFSLRPDDRFSLLSGLAHDPLHRDVFTALWVGAAVAVPDGERFAEPGYLAAWMGRAGVTVMHGTPSLLRLVSTGAGSERDGGEDGEPVVLPALRWAFLVGEALRPGDLARLRGLAPRALAVNLYGATETQRAVAWHPVAPPRRQPAGGDGGRVQPGAAGADGAGPDAAPVGSVVPLGRGMPDVQLLVLGRRGGLAGVGEIGEIHVRSPHLAAGYLGRPADTAAVFVPDPFAAAGAGAGGVRLYRAGDLGRYRPDGAVQPLGRRDRQVKVRGHRVEPAEVEAALAAHPAVAETAVVARGEASDARLIAYWTPVAGDLRGLGGGPSGDAGEDGVPGLADGDGGGGEAGAETLPADAAISQPTAVAEAELRSHLAARLPAAMVPSALVRLDALPRTPNGKLDRAALPDVEAVGATASGEPPKTGTEQRLAAIWRQVLGVERVARDDDFFARGGHSLALTRVLARVADAFAVELPVRRAFEEPTLAGQAAAVDELRRRTAPAGPPLVPRDRAADPPPASPAQRRLWFLDRLSPGSAAYTLSAAVELRGDLHPGALAGALTAMARRHEALRTTLPAADGEPVQRIAPVAATRVRLPRVDLADLPADHRQREAERLTASAARHRFDLATGPLLAAWLVRLDPGSPAGRRAAPQGRPTGTGTGVSGDVPGTSSPVPAVHRLLLAFHHAIADGWSLGVMAGELGALYDVLSAAPAVTSLEALCRRAGLPELPIQYADWSLWQRDLLAGPELEEQVTWWRRRLHGLPPALELPTDRPRGRREDHRGAQVEHRLPPSLVAGMERLERRNGVTRYVLLLSALAVVLSRWSGQDDLAVGSPEAGRGRREVEPLVGLFLNLLVLRVDLSDAPTFGELLARVRDTVLGASAHRGVPFERLLEAVAPARDPARPPLVEVLLNVLDLPGAGGGFAGLEARLAPPVEREARFPLTVYAWSGGGRGDGAAVLRLVYQRALFDRERMVELLAQVEGVLAAAVEDAARPVALLGGLTERGRRVLADPAAALEVPKTGTVTEAFDRGVERWGAETAVADDASSTRSGSESGLCWTYSDLASAAARIADVLSAAGSVDGEVVAVGGDPSPGWVAAMLAAWRVGGVLLLLDPALPVARRAEVMRRADARWLLLPEDDPAAAEMEAELGAAFPFHLLRFAADGSGLRVAGGIGGEVPPARRFGEDAAYVVFTSGSTGEPKGVVGSHRGLAHFLAWQRETFGVGPGDRVAQLTAPSFDVVLRDLFLPLTAGATLVLPADPALRLDPARVPGWLERHRVSVVHAVPTLARAWLAAGGADEVDLAALRWVFFAGEPLPADLVTAWRRAFPAAPASRPDTGHPPRHGLVNLYGPTETTLARCAFVVPEPPEPGVQPVGRALPGSQALVLAAVPDGDGGIAHRRCGPGEVGEIVLRTASASHGYLAADGGLEQPFFANPFRAGAADGDFSHLGGDRLYATGDLGRFRLDGTLEILGRRDGQVKVRGVRLDPAEVEAALAGHAAVAAAAVTPERDGTGLVAWVVPAAGAEVDPRRLRAHLARRLPPALVPGRFLPLDRLPTGPTGKVDRRALPVPPPAATVAEPVVPPRDELERALAGLFEEVLEVAPVGARNGFFELGGHSLLAVPLLSRVESRLGHRLPLAALFAHPTVEELAALLRAAGAGDSAAGRPSPSLVTLQEGEPGRPPLFLVHPGGGGVLCYADLARELGADQPVHALQSAGLDGGEPPLASIDDMATRYLAEVRGVRAAGPYHLAGWSFGGRVVFEMARRLRRAGEEVALLALLDVTPDPSPGGAAGRGEDDAALLARALAETMPVAADELRGLDDRAQAERLLAAARDAAERRGLPAAEVDPRRAEALLAVFKSNLHAARAFRQRPCPGEVLLVRAADGDRFAAPPDADPAAPAAGDPESGDPTGGWAGLADRVRLVSVPGDHHSMVRPPHVARLAAVLRRALDRAAGARQAGAATAVRS